MRADELFKEAELQGYVEPSRREGPPKPEEADQMSNWDIDICMARQGSEGWSSFADKAIATVRRLEDLRRWRPMSEKPLATSVLVRQSRVPRRAATSSFDLEEGEWAWPRHSTETSYEWTYIPGQEPKEEV